MRHTSQMHILETQNWKRNTEKPECSRNSVVVARLHLQVHRMQVWSTYRQTRHSFNRTFRSWILPSKALLLFCQSIVFPSKCTLHNTTYFSQLQFTRELHEYRLLATLSNTDSAANTLNRQGLVSTTLKPLSLPILGSR